MYRITLNFESENSVPIIDEACVRMFKESRMPIPKSILKTDDKISFNTEKLPSNEEAMEIGETYRQSFNEACKNQGKEIEKVSIRFIGITDIEEIN